MAYPDDPAPEEMRRRVRELLHEDELILAAWEGLSESGWNHGLANLLSTISERIEDHANMLAMDRQAGASVAAGDIRRWRSMGNVIDKLSAKADLLY